MASTSLPQNEKEETQTVLKSDAGSNQGRFDPGLEKHPPKKLLPVLTRVPPILLERLTTISKTLQEAYDQFQISTNSKVVLSPAAEWMLDNYYLLQQTINQIRHDLPIQYYNQLPKAADENVYGLPRVFILVAQVFSHCNHYFDLECLKRSLKHYQQQAPLTMGELWCLPTMLRYILLERLASSVAIITGIDIPDWFKITRQDEEEANALVANGIPALRQIDTTDWKAVFEELSIVEQILQGDPAGDYPHMDFATRDRYRREIEKLAFRSKKSEVFVASETIELARQVDESCREGSRVLSLSCRAPQNHVGYYLFSDGINRLKQQLGISPKVNEIIKGWLLKNKTGIFIGSINLLSVLLLGLMLAYAFFSGGNPIQFFMVFLVGIIPAMTISVNLINIVVTNIVPPDVLHKMDYSTGIPAQYKTFVVIPSIVIHDSDATGLLSQIELHFLSNEDENIRFGLLTDFADAPNQHMDNDDQLLALLTSGIQQLNEKYRKASNDQPFFLFHRERRWNESEQCWMAWERKRGKLVELNKIILENAETSYVVKIGDISWLSDVCYVITLDSDTILPQGVAKKLIATFSHPLNQAVFDEKFEKIISGYTILQPRVQVKPTTVVKTYLTRLFAGEIGLDLYSRAVSDVYQDLFNEGIYVGKGIYDVRAFERSVSGKIPENALLSHDLFEGVLGRAALVTDINFYEDYPTHYLAYAHRMHRWIRGDWQLLPWLFSKVPAQNRQKISNPLSTISRWKILDNLRRSLMPINLTVLLLLGWMALPGSVWAWNLIALSVLIIPLLYGLFLQATRNVSDDTIHVHNSSLITNFYRLLLNITFLLYETTLAGDAILTTIIRLYITHKHLLRWATTAHTLQLFRKQHRLGVTWKQMGSASIFAVIITLIIRFVKPNALLFAFPFLAVWIVSPYVATWVSVLQVKKREEISEQEISVLRKIALRTWLYFSIFVTPEDHSLPPDHFQEFPLRQVAHRTSPTNIGLLLTSEVAAMELGYIGPMDLTIRIQSTLSTIQEMEKQNGHLFNWYDTQNLSPLFPRYISTVDSGNLVICLLAAKNYINGLPEMKILRWQRIHGLLDTLGVVHEIIQGLGKEFNTSQLSSNIQKLQSVILNCKEKPDQWYALLENLRSDGTTELGSNLLSFVESHNKVLSQESLAELRIWIEQFSFQIYDLQREIDNLAPWIGYFQRIPGYFSAQKIDPLFNEIWDSLKSVFVNDVQLGKLPDIFTSGTIALQKLVNALEERRIGDLDSGAYQNWAEALNWCKELYRQFQISQNLVYVMLDGWRQIEDFSEKFIRDMDFNFLFNKERQVFHIGYNVESERLDTNFYDLFASEARIASLVAIAKGDVPDSHWLHLARPFTVTNGMTALLSWSATMFEYLMPSLFFKTEENTLTGLSIDAAIKAQKIYAKKHNVPWGISESAFYHFDSQLNYQYQAFGVPGLGLKRGLDEDLVISPYSSLIALEFDLQNVLTNVEKLDRLNAKGLYGYFDAIDFTPGRAQTSSGEVVKTYMAHHQGMILLSLVNYLSHDIIKSQLQSDPRFYTVNLLLYETIPQKIPLIIPHNIREPRAIEEGGEDASTISWNYPGETPVPQVHLLSNGDYSVMITNAGTGYSQWQGVDLTRWRPDTTLDNYGTFLFVKDLDRGKNWSAAFQPLHGNPHQFSAQFEPHKANFINRADDLVIETSVCVTPDDPVEIRKMQITNHSNKKRNLQIFSYGEVILHSQMADSRHPAFNKLFIDSDFDIETKTLFFERRQRTEEDELICLGHSISTSNPNQAKYLFCSDREKFIGRGGNIQSPGVLKNQTHVFDNPFEPDKLRTQLDPIFCAGLQIELNPHTAYSLAFLTIADETRLKVKELALKYQNWNQIEVSFTQAFNLSRQNMKQLELTTKELKQYHQLLSLLLYPNRALRANTSVLAANELGQSSLWQYAVSGDYPILLIRIESETDASILTELINAYLYYRSINQMVDLVIFNDHDTGYNQEMQNLVFRLINRLGGGRFLNQRGGIFLLRSELIPIEQRILFETCARVIIRPNSGPLDEQLQKMFEHPIQLPGFQPALQVQDEQYELQSFKANQLQFFNGLGGFSKDGKEYCIILEDGKNTPAPWINVIANERFGYWISESGMGTTWAENSGENKITTWNNDPLIDNQGEAIYLRDEDTGHIWSPSPLPCRSKTTYFIRHGQGYSVFENSNAGIITSLTYSIAKDDPVKFALLRIQNISNRIRRISATYYAEWVLGPDCDLMRPYIITDFDTTTHTLLARNPYNTDFKKQVAFLTATRSPHGVTGSRVEFLGRNGNFQNPAAMRRVGLASTIEAGMDPCAAFQQLLWLAPGEVKEVTFLLGCGKTEKESEELISKYQVFDNVKSELERNKQFWNEISSTINVKTPEPSLDLMLNHWLPYQALGCRIWGRSAMYQSSGAFGFRDQLQDVLALQFSKPEYVRSHIIEAAKRQFLEGDVLHWWHPPYNRGVRTRCSDDLLWLPYVLCHYIDATGDLSILDEKIPFLQAAPLRPEETERYDRYQPGQDNEATLLEHCRRAIEKGCTRGKHNLPLIGSHDWNDGMNRVGIKGKGESVWMGWFLIDVLNRFSALCEKINRKQLATLFMGRREEYIKAIQANAWDGEWYLRAFYDNGKPMGSNNNTECRIDAIAQSWAVISGVAEHNRSVSAMNAVWTELVKENEGIVLLFTPSFNHSDQNPGYIKGYKPGVRENGGQYTHASTWTGWAFAELGDFEKALKVFRMISPISHSDTPEKIHQYRIEPYVVAADIYGEPPFTGRGGWTWYTGSAGWLYRFGLEKILGFKKEGEYLIINPAIPRDWNGYQIDYRYGTSRYSIAVTAPITPFTAVKEVILDDVVCPDHKIPLKDDGKQHFVKISLG